MPSCELCGQRLDETNKSILADWYCRQCACDPVVPKAPIWWNNSSLTKANFRSVRSAGLFAKNFKEAIQKDAEYGYGSRLDSLYEDEIDHYQKTLDIESELRNFIEWRISEDSDQLEADLQEALQSSSPFMTLGEMGYYDPDDELSNMANNSVEQFWQDANHANDDVEYAMAINHFPQVGDSIWRHLANLAYSQKDCKTHELYLKFAIANHIKPEEMDYEFIYTTIDETDIAGMCDQCNLPVTRYAFSFNGKLDTEVICNHCNVEILIRSSFLWWSHLTGRLNVAWETVAANENDWIVWPCELDPLFVSGQIKPEIY